MRMVGVCEFVHKIILYSTCIILYTISGCLRMCTCTPVHVHVYTVYIVYMYNYTIIICIHMYMYIYNICNIFTT